MLRFLLRLTMLCWIALTAFLFVSLSIGKTAPEISKIAFFHHRIDATGTDYWRLDLFSGIAFNDSYSGFIFIPEIRQAPLQHFLSITGDANYYVVSEVNLYNRELSFVAYYPSRGYFLHLAGDYIFTYDLANQWRRIRIADGELDYFGRYPNLQSMRVSPDGQWITGTIYTHNWLFINILDGSSYEIPPHAYLTWSPNSRYYLLGDYRTISVLNAADGSVLMADIPARLATWTPDGQSLILENQDKLSLLSIATGQTSNYSAQYSFFWLQCLSPDNRYILSHDDKTIYLLELETNSNQALLPLPSSAQITCLWSADNRYLAFHLTTANDEQIYFIDSQTKAAFQTFPANLPNELIYLHIPD